MSRVLGKKKLVKDISANTIQTVVTQFFGLLIFYVTSRYLPKDDFGEFNWSMALGFTIIAMASLGLDLVFVKRIASGEDVLQVSGIHFFHTVVVGVVLTTLALAVALILPSFQNSHPLFFYVFLNIAIINIANSFKLGLNGLDAYSKLAILAICTNVFKLSMVILLFVTQHFTILNIVFSFIASSIIELSLGYILMNRSIKARVKPLLKVVEYKYFILESLPQLGVTIFDSALSRMDLILLGILSTATITAEYSFVYKVYELSKLPIIIIGPVLLTRFSKLFGNNKLINEEQKQQIRIFFRWELFIIMLIPLGLLSTWTPLVDHFTSNKYGSVNELNYGILSICVPLVCMVNFLWTLGFVQGQLKTIMIITMVVSVLNITLNLMAIPFYGGLGAALSFVVSSIIQVALYLRFIDQSKLRVHFIDGGIIFLCAFAAFVVSKLLGNNIIFTTIICFVLYFVFAFLLRQVSLKELRLVLSNHP